MTEKKPRKKAMVNKKYCVACGVCVKNCPFQAISISKGTYAEMNHHKCVGCAKCTMVCPADTIDMKEVDL